MNKERIYGAALGWKNIVQDVVDLFLYLPYATNRIAAGVPTVSNVAITTTNATGITATSFVDADNNGVIIRLRNSTGAGTNQLMTWKGYVTISQETE